jgi:hypothetical protein
MSNEPIIESMEALKDWFFQNSMPKFTLYRGHDNTASKRILHYKAETAEKAWETLNSTLKNFGYRGNYYVFVTDSKTDSGGGFSTMVELYGRNDRRSNGINGVDGGAPNGYLTIEQAQMMIDNALTKDKIGRLEEEIEALRQGGGNQKELSPLEKIFHEALQDEGSGKEMISGVKNFMSSIGIAAINFSKAFANGKGVTTGITGISEVEKSKKKAAAVQEETEYEDVTEYEEKDLDWRKAGEITERMKRLFPDNTPQNVVNALAKFLEENPHMKDIVYSQVSEKIEAEEKIPSPND